MSDDLENTLGDKNRLARLEELSNRCTASQELAYYRQGYSDCFSLLCWMQVLHP